MRLKNFFSLSLLGSLVMAISAHAEGEAAQILLNALTNCPTAVNPDTALRSAGGNVLTNPRLVPSGGSSSDGNAVLVDFVRDPQVLNPMIGAPTVFLGTAEVQMNYPAPGRGLVCSVAFKPR